MRIAVLAVAIALSAPGCGPESPPSFVMASGPFRNDFTPPPLPTSDRLVLEVLEPAWTRLDYEAFMGSREYLHETLGWGEWPRADMTQAENWEDLFHHKFEYDQRSAFAWTVLDPTRTRCLGCVYLNPRDPPGANPWEKTARLQFWVIDTERTTGLDEHLVALVLGWLERSWPLNSVYFALTPENERAIAIVERFGVRSLDSDEATGLTKNRSERVYLAEFDRPAAK